MLPFIAHDPRTRIAGHARMRCFVAYGCARSHIAIRRVIAASRRQHTRVGSIALLPRLAITRGPTSTVFRLARNGARITRGPLRARHLITRLRSTNTRHIVDLKIARGGIRRSNRKNEFECIGIAVEIESPRDLFPIRAVDGRIRGIGSVAAAVVGCVANFSSSANPIGAVVIPIRQRKSGCRKAFVRGTRVGKSTSMGATVRRGDDIGNRIIADVGCLALPPDWQ